MLSSLIKSSGSLRCFSTAVSASSIGSVKREDVIGSTDPKWIGTVTKAVMQSGDQSGNHSDALNEYFRKNFRKLTSAQALSIIGEMA